MKRVNKKYINVNNKGFFNKLVNSIIIGLVLFIFLFLFSIFVIKNSCKTQDDLNKYNGNLATINPQTISGSNIGSCESMMHCYFCEKCESITSIDDTVINICIADDKKNFIPCTLPNSPLGSNDGKCYSGFCRTQEFINMIKIDQNFNVIRGKKIIYTHKSLSELI
jgi:hypothetical protein